MAPEATEQYLKTIFKLTEGGGTARTSEIALMLGVSPATVTEMLHKLAQQGFIRHEPYKGVVLKPRGRRLACKVARKHRLLERFLNDVVGVTGKSQHEQACKMEHALSDEAEHQLCKMMNRPETCPGGRRIPKCQRAISCEQCTAETVPLLDLDEGEAGTISHLASEDREELCRILSMGFVPGAEVTIEKKVPMGGPLIVSLKGTKVAVAREIGRALHIVRAA
jgi:DtxR family Mn-dependent transcriptional regulator